MDAPAEQGALFGSPQLPPGLAYRADFLTDAEESVLLAAFGRLPFREATYQQYLARRRVVVFGLEYDDDHRGWVGGEPPPPALERVRSRVAQWVDVPPDAFVHALVTEYRPGTPIGWHRDAPHYGFVVGVSLGSACRMRFRPFDEPPNRRTTFALDLAPRSAYAIHGPMRWGWQHSIPPTKGLRYSITFRTRADGVREPGPALRG
jgi:alkylated DNA repair dioxygenase AlkB